MAGVWKHDIEARMKATGMSSSEAVVDKDEHLRKRTAKQAVTESSPRKGAAYKVDRLPKIYARNSTDKLDALTFVDDRVSATA